MNHPFAAQAGAASHAKIPYLFQLVDGMGLNYTTTQVAAAALDGVEKGWSTVLVPGFLLIPTTVSYTHLTLPTIYSV